MLMLGGGGGGGGGKISLLVLPQPRAKAKNTTIEPKARRFIFHLPSRQHVCPNVASGGVRGKKALRRGARIYDIYIRSDITHLSVMRVTRPMPWCWLAK